MPFTLRLQASPGLTPERTIGWVGFSPTSHATLRGAPDFYNCDETEISRLFSNQNAAVLKSVISSSKLIFLDEAQRADNIGLTIKIIVDTFPDVQVLASGSSAFELSDKLSEPLTGRKWEYQLYPLSFEELATHTKFLQIGELSDCL